MSFIGQKFLPQKSGVSKLSSLVLLFGLSLIPITSHANFFHSIDHAFKKGFHKVKHGVEKGFHETEHGVKKGFHETEKGVKTAVHETDHALKVAGHALENGFAEMGKIMINLPKLSKELGKELMVVPGMLNRETGGLLAPVMKSFLGNYWDYLRVADYVAKGVITGKSKYYKRALKTGKQILIKKEHMIKGLVKGIKKGDPAAIETVAMLALNAGNNSSEAFAETFSVVTKGVKGYQKVQQYKTRFESAARIAGDIKDKNYKDAARTGGKWARSEYDYHQGQDHDDETREKTVELQRAL